MIVIFTASHEDKFQRTPEKKIPLQYLMLKDHKRFGSIYYTKYKIAFTVKQVDNN